MKHSDRIYLLHILDAIETIETYLRSVDEDDFQLHKLTQDGVIRQLEIIGEATKNISRPLREENDQIPWQDIAGMRDKLIHAYFGVDIGTVWLTAQDDIPALKVEIRRILESLE
jgi:uncharacterized protein with HEPN domain